jgi:hypothetical protein
MDDAVLLGAWKDPPCADPVRNLVGVKSIRPRTKGVSFLVKWNEYVIIRARALAKCRTDAEANRAIRATSTS